MSDFQNTLSKIDFAQAVVMWESYFTGLNQYKIRHYTMPKIGDLKKEISVEIQNSPFAMEPPIGMIGLITESCFFMDKTLTWMGFVKYNSDGKADINNSFFITVSQFLTLMRNGMLSEVIDAISDDLKSFLKSDGRFLTWDDKDLIDWKFDWSLYPTMNLTSLVLGYVKDKPLPFMNWSQNPFEQK